MAGIVAAAPSIKLVRRVMTRAPDLGGEVYESLSETAFLEAAKRGAYCVQWYAHSLHYGIPAGVLADVHAGRDCIANFSRAALPEASRLFPQITVISLTATLTTLQSRLTARGRETAEDIKARLDRAATPLPPKLRVIEISNDSALDDTVRLALKALHPVRA